MCFPKSPAPTPAPPPPAAPPAAAPRQTTQLGYDPSNPESGIAAELGAISNKAKGTSLLVVPLDPTVTNIGAGGSGLQIT